METDRYHFVDVYAKKTEPRFRLRRVLWLVLAVVELLLITRFLLKLFVPHSAGVLGSVTYSSTEYVLFPFTVIFGASSTPGPVVEWITLFAIPYYLVLVVGILTLYRTSTNKSQIEKARAYSKWKYGH